jgi:MraZ protein
MFYGQKELTVDDKGRLMLPSSYRNEFQGDVCYACFGLDGCIEVYPKPTYDVRAARIIALNDFDAKAREIKRTFYSNTFDIPMDSHNRILLPKALVDKTQTGKKVVVVGMYDHLEVWDSDIFLKLSQEGDKNYASNAEKLVS